MLCRYEHCQKQSKVAYNLLSSGSGPREPVCCEGEEVYKGKKTQTIAEEKYMEKLESEEEIN